MRLRFCFTCGVFLFAVSILKGHPSTIDLKSWGEKQEVAKPLKYPRYRVGTSVRSVAGDPSLLLQISVDPKHYNQEEMKLLAEKINRDFAKEQRLHAVIFDNFRSAKKFVFHEHSPTYRKDLKAIRGDYHLDRIKGESYISYLPDPGKPENVIKINISVKE